MRPGDDHLIGSQQGLSFGMQLRIGDQINLMALMGHPHQQMAVGWIVPQA